MIKTYNKKLISVLFLVTLIAVVFLFFYGVNKTYRYNEETYTESYSGLTLFSEKNRKSDVFVNAIARDDSWAKIFDLNNEGLTENNYQAYTYDFTIYNTTSDKVDDFKFRLTFSELCFLSSAWNGSLEIHQNVKGNEVVDYVEDLRVFDPKNYKFEIFEVEGESFIKMYPGDYLIYYPSSSINAMEIPIDSGEATTPGLILYVDMNRNVENSTLDFEYSFNKSILREPLVVISLFSAAIWAIALLFVTAMEMQAKRFRERHQRDNQIIEESIDTFTGFIDAKDPYTNGHSKRVALYTRLIAQELGYEGEDLDRIYYIALLHDCGKIGVPDNVLGKPGKLTDEEFQIIKSHTVKGGEILRSFKSIEGVNEGALYHHERYDGRGYPEGRAGEDIPYIARMICVADSFDAMNTNRVYREKLSKETIMEEIRKNKGKQFDPEIADVMLKLIDEGTITIDRIS